MNIQTQGAAAYTPRYPSGGAPEAPLKTEGQAADTPAPELQVRADQVDRADRYDGSRTLGNYVSSMVTGAVAETVDATVKALPLAANAVKNLWNAETVGPNLKVLGTLAALPGAGLTVVAAPFYGAGTGVSSAKRAMRGERGPLTQDVSGQVAQKRFPQGEESTSMSSSLMRSFDKLGAQKLREGEKPRDIPLLSPLFALAGSVISGAISGVAGAVVGLTAGALTGAKEIGGALFGENQGLGDRAVRAGAGLITPVVMGTSLGWNGLKESMPRGFSDGWKHGPIQPVADTIRSTAALAGAVYKEAWER